VSKSIRSARVREQQPIEMCAQCGHPETDHGTTGFRPCLAMVGDVLHREFCKCDSFRKSARKAA